MKKILSTLLLIITCLLFTFSLSSCTVRTMFPETWIAEMLVQGVDGDFEITEAYITKDNVVSKVIFYDEEGVQYIAYFVHEDFSFYGRNFYEGAWCIRNRSDETFEYILSSQQVKELNIWKINSDAALLDIIL